MSDPETERLRRDRRRSSTRSQNRPKMIDTVSCRWTRSGCSGTLLPAGASRARHLEQATSAEAGRLLSSHAGALPCALRQGHPDMSDPFLPASGRHQGRSRCRRICRDAIRDAAEEHKLSAASLRNRARLAWGSLGERRKQAIRTADKRQEEADYRRRSRSCGCWAARTGIVPNLRKPTEPSWRNGFARTRTRNRARRGKLHAATWVSGSTEALMTTIAAIK